MIGIHQRTGSFSDRWIEVCRERNIPFRLVNCLRTDILEQCGGLEAILWHWSLNDARELLIARQVAAAMKQRQIVMFPNWETCWHYDDKIAQKYLLESIEAPLIPTWVFTDPLQAKEWIAKATWPKVFKLRCGAGSSNVRLVRSRSEAAGLCDRAFGRGFPAEMVRMDAVQRYLGGRRNAKDLTRRLWRLARKAFLKVFGRSDFPRERGYIYFQEFIPDNSFDTRVTVIGDRAFAFTRDNRPGDFRASGSGRLSYDPGRIDRRCIEIAFEVAQRLRSQSLAFDFLFDETRVPLIGEISYCYMAKAVYDCAGHWDANLKWREGHLWPQDAILEDICAKLLETKAPVMTPASIS